MRPRVYVAGPISKGDRAENIRRGVEAGLRLLSAGCAPFIPHLSMYAEPEALAGTPRYEDWLSSDFAWIAVCAAVLHLSGESAGADREVAFARALRVPVYTDIEALLSDLLPRA